MNNQIAIERVKVDIPEEKKSNIEKPITKIDHFFTMTDDQLEEEEIHHYIPNRLLIASQCIKRNRYNTESEYLRDMLKNVATTIRIKGARIDRNYNIYIKISIDKLNSKYLYASVTTVDWSKMYNPKFNIDLCLATKEHYEGNDMRDSIAFKNMCKGGYV